MLGLLLFLALASGITLLETRIKDFKDIQPKITDAQAHITDTILTSTPPYAESSAETDKFVYNNVYKNNTTEESILKNESKSIDLSTQNEAEILPKSLSRKNDTKISENVEKKDDQQAQAIEATLYVLGNVYPAYIAPESTVFDLMIKLQENGLAFTYTDFGSHMGIFIDSINGRVSDTKKNLYWIYYINGVEAKIGVSNYIIQPNDIIEWKYEAPSF